MVFHVEQSGEAGAPMPEWEYSQQKAAANQRALPYTGTLTQQGAPAQQLHLASQAQRWRSLKDARIAELESENAHVRDMIARQSEHHCDLVAKYAELEAENARLIAAIAALQIEDAPPLPVAQSFPANALKHSI